MPGEMPEQVAPQIAGDRDQRRARYPPCKPPQQIVRRDQGRQQQKSQPDVEVVSCRAPRQDVDQELDGELRPYRATDRGDHRDPDDRMSDGTRLHVARHERQRTIGIPADIFHMAAGPRCDVRFSKGRIATLQSGSGFRGGQPIVRRNGTMRVPSERRGVAAQSYRSSPFAARESAAASIRRPCVRSQASAAGPAGDRRRRPRRGPGMRRCSRNDRRQVRRAPCSARRRCPPRCRRCRARD